MEFEISGAYARPYRPPLYNLRWSAVIAGLVVVIAVHLLLLLLGGTAGLALVDAGAKANEGMLLTAASLLNMLAMVVASVVGGYVAARASGMRRTADGVLHGALAWGVAMLVSVTLATTAGVALSDSFGAPDRPPVAAETAPELDLDERMALMDSLERRLGWDSEQANSVVEQVLIFSGREGGRGSPMEPRLILRAASMISGWLSMAILLSLLGAIVGGMFGARSTTRRASPAQPEASEREVAE